jgi:hypothetical protein
VFRSFVFGFQLRWALICAIGAGIALAVAAFIMTADWDEAEDVETTPAATATSAVTPGVAGRDSTGDRDLDQVIAAVLSGDRARMESLVGLQNVPCGIDTDSGNRMGCGSLPPGTLLPAFAHLACDETYWTPGDQYPWIDSLQGRSPQLYAVYRQDPTAAEPPAEAPRGSAVAVFKTDVNGGFALDALDGRIVSERAACGPFPYSLLLDVPAGRYILLPPGGIPVPTPTASPRLTGDPATDRLIRAVVDGDIRAIASSFELLPEPCATNPQGVGSPPKCPPGVPDGGEVLMARVMACERAYLSTPADFEALLKPLLRFPHTLYAVYATDGAFRFDFVPTGKLAIVTAEGPGRGEWAQTWFVSEGRFTGALLGCGESAARAVAGVAPGAFLIPPE